MSDDWKLDRLQYFVPAEMDFVNEKIGKIEAHYKTVAQKVFKLNLPHFIDKDKKGKRVTISFDGENLKEIFNNIKKYNG